MKGLLTPVGRLVLAFLFAFSAGLYFHKWSATGDLGALAWCGFNLVLVLINTRDLWGKLGSK